MQMDRYTFITAQPGVSEAFDEFIRLRSKITGLHRDGDSASGPRESSEILVALRSAQDKWLEQWDAADRVYRQHMKGSEDESETGRR